MARTVIAVDLGGTKAVIARLDSALLKVQSEETIPTRAKDGMSAVLDDVIAAIERQRSDDTEAVGIGMAGLISKGVLWRSPNIAKSDNIKVKELLEKKLKLPVSISNDANCFTLAEARLGVAKGRKVVVGITFGTGVGGGIVIDGKIFEGAHGYGGEIGHMLLMPGNPPYETEDKRGRVEQFLSGTSMGKRCEAASSPEDYLEGAVCSFMQPDIYREVAWLCASLISLLDPDMIVFGGSAGHSLAKHIDAIEEELKKWTLAGRVLPDIAAAKAKNSGVLGAALLCA